MKGKDKATIVIVVGVIVFLAIDLYAAATDPANNTQEGTTQKSGVIQPKPVQQSTPETTETKTDPPLLRIDVGSPSFAWLILAVVIGAPVGYGVYKNLDAVAYRIRGREKQQKED